MTPHSTPIPSPVPVRTPSEPDEAARDADASAGSDEASRDAAPIPIRSWIVRAKQRPGWRARWCSQKGSSRNSLRRNLPRCAAPQPRARALRSLTMQRCCPRHLRSMRTRASKLTRRSPLFASTPVNRCRSPRDRRAPKVTHRPRRPILVAECSPGGAPIRAWCPQKRRSRRRLTLDG